MKIIQFCTLAFASVSLCGCNLMFDDREPVISQTSIANPASMYCVEQNGLLETVSESDRRVTYCVLEDGEMKEEWAYYREGQLSESEEMGN